MMYLGKDAVGLTTSIPIFADKIEKIEYGEYIPQSDELATNISIPHSLGTTPDFVIYTTDGIDFNVTPSATYIVEGHVCIHGSANGSIYYIVSGIRFEKDTSNMKLYQAITTPELLASTFKITDNSFHFLPGSGYTLKANIKYKYILGKFKEVTPNANE